MPKPNKKSQKSTDTISVYTIIDAFHVISINSLLFGFQLLFINPQRAKDGTHMFDAKYRYVFVV